MIEGDKNGIAKVSALDNWRDSDLYSEQERVAIEYGERMTLTESEVDDTFFARLREHFDDAQIVELTAGIAMENFRSKLNVALKVAAQGFCMLPKA